MIQDSIIQNGGNPVKDDKIIKLIFEKDDLIKQIATLKKALELACERIEQLEKMGGCESAAFEIERTFIQEGQKWTERTAKKNEKSCIQKARQRNIVGIYRHAKL